MSRLSWIPRPIWLNGLLIVMITCACVVTADIASPMSTGLLAPRPLRQMRKSPYELFSFAAGEDGLKCTDVLHVSTKEQCQFVKTYCSDDELGFFNYIRFYYCTPTRMQSLIFVTMTVWLIALFTTIGITASDFLCPNLNTMSRLFGLSENLAGVTFLALGNGSPDVFSTYAAMKVGSGSLAVGELIGAASFIISIVAGSMAIICPFTVDWLPFTRDLSFFILAVALAMYCLADGVIVQWECVAMVLFYVLYVSFVVWWHWFTTRPGRIRLEHERFLTATSQPSLEQTPSLSSYESMEPPPSYYSDVFNSADTESGEPSSLLSRSSSDIDIEQSADHSTYMEIQQTMRLQRPWANNTSYNGNSYSESPNLATSAPIRPSLIGALELHSAVQRGRNPIREHKEEDTRRVLRHRRSVSHGLLNMNSEVSKSRARQHHQHHHSHSHILRHSHRTSVDSTYGLRTFNNRRLVFQENSFLDGPNRSHSATDLRYSGGSATLSPSILSSISPSPSIQSTSRPPTLLISDIQNDGSFTQLPYGSQSPTITFSAPSLRQQPDMPNYQLRQSLLGPNRSRSNSIQTNASSRALSPNVRIGRRAHTRTGSTLIRQSRSPSPFDRFLAFQSDAVTHPHPSFSESSSRIEEADLISFNDQDGNQQLQGNVSASGDHLDVPDLDRRHDLLSDISEHDSSYIAGSDFTWSRWCCIPRPYVIQKTLFPTITDMSEKTSLNKVISILAVPSVLLLTVTVPVIEMKDDNVDVSQFDPESEYTNSTLLHRSDDDRDGISDVRQRLKGWSKWLVGLQCIFGPLSVMSTNFFDSDDFVRDCFYTFFGGLVTLLVVMYFTESHKAPIKLLPILCFIGFIVSISWISAVAVEVVGLLKAFGIIFGISDAVLGLTVFALGNSLGDFISNITVAKMGYPMMAISACFGSPMLNILLGIGISGVLTLPRTASDGSVPSYHLDIAYSLVVTATSLLINLILFLIWVPLNGWKMTRAIGFASVSLWVVSTTINVVLEATGRNN
ncbi:Sodium/calcium exchanger protein-domain-containing protein [Lipomyces japonicus]|uniref:Sodium/calcium exchanger protein-domain-containing protein n=1 Tax=Lipomyces japonicus TaxID=56871 RepID=UPI0034CF7B5B